MIQSILLSLAGLALFVFGMTRLSLVAKTLLSARVRKLILFSVKKPLYGIATGIFATIVFQSSSATTLVGVSLVSAGLINLYNSLGIILGADIGTTITVQLVAWKFAAFSPLFMVFGILVWFLAHDNYKSLGEATFCFGLVFFGLDLISVATTPFRDNEAFLTVFRTANNPWIGLAAGTVFTCIVQASAIPISILVVLGMQDIVTLDQAVPILVGANVGTTITAILGGIVGTVDAKRSAVAHVITKTVTALIVIGFLGPFTSFLGELTANIPQQIAFGHFFFNLLLVLLFLPFLRPFSRFMIRVIPGQSDVIPLWPQYLNKECLNCAEDALSSVQMELIREISLTRTMLSKGLGMIHEYHGAQKRDLSYIELVVDNLHYEITDYLWNISCKDLSPSLTKRLFAFSAIVYDIERIGDHALNLGELAQSRHERRAFFSPPALTELREIGRLVLGSLDDASSLIKNKERDLIEHLIMRDIEIHQKIARAFDKHLERFYEKACKAEAGPIFVDMLVNLGRVSDHCRLIGDRIHAVDG